MGGRRAGRGKGWADLPLGDAQAAKDPPLQQPDEGRGGENHDIEQDDLAKRRRAKDEGADEERGLVVGRRGGLGEGGHGGDQGV